MPVVLVGNKIDLRGNDVANQGLEDEVIPIMNEFKVPLLFILGITQIDNTFSVGGRDLCRMFS